MPHENRHGRWKRTITTASTAIVLATVPVLGILFLGSWQVAPAQAADVAGLGLSADFLTLDKPVQPASTPSEMHEPARGGSAVEIRLEKWENTGRVPTRFN